MAKYMKVVWPVWILFPMALHYPKHQLVLEGNMSAYIAYFDTLGFEWIVNVSEYEKKKFWAVLKGDDKVDFPIPRYAILRAQANPQRFPEIWAFESDISQDELEEYAKDTPQELADAIRRCGQNVFKTPKNESVIV
jgi:hypothetical protein